MQDLRIALVQADQKWENKNANFSNYEKLLLNISDVDLILLPEMFNTGFSMNAEDLAEDMNSSLSIKWLQELASKKDSAVYTSMIIKENKSFFNRGLFVQPTGDISYYDKRKCFGLAGEDKVFSAGQKEVIVDYRLWKIQLQICYDLRFPEISRNGLDSDGNANYDLLLYVANWPEKRAEHWNALLKARAIENQAFVAAVNRVGKDGKELNYSGDSQLIGALGEVEKAEANQECVKEITISKRKLQEIREMLPFLKDR